MTTTQKKSKESEGSKSYKTSKKLKAPEKGIKGKGEGKGKGSSTESTKSSSSKMKGVKSKGKGESKEPKAPKSTKMPEKMPKSTKMPSDGGGAAEVPNPLPIGNIRPEGITEGEGSTLFFTNLFYGGVQMVDVSTGDISEVVPNYGYFERAGVGLIYDDGFLFVCGAGPPFGLNETALHVYDVSTGEEVVTCTSEEPGFFFNDIAISGGVGYITDSQYPGLTTLDIDAAKTGECVVGTVDLPPEIFLSEDPNVFVANGKLGRGLLIVNLVLKILSW